MPTTDPDLPHQQGGRLRSESVAALDRNGWPPSVGITGRFASDSAVYGAVVQIDGLDRPYPIEVGLANLIPGLAMLLGRDMISKYRMVFDTPNKEFYLENTAG